MKTEISSRQLSPLKVTVITVVRNAVDTIERTIRSVASQSYSNVEHIIIDGASTDGTSDIIRRHAATGAKCIFESDKGLYDAMNKGIRLATGGVIGFLHADDYYAHDHIVEDIALVMGSESLDAIFGDVVFFKPEQPQRVVRRYCSASFCPERVSWGWMPAHPALYVRRQLFDQIGLFRTDYRIAGDFEWVARVFRSRVVRYRYLPEVFVHMRTGGISTGGWRNTLLLNREVMRACRENSIATNWFKILSKYAIKLLEFAWPFRRM